MFVSIPVLIVLGFVDFVSDESYLKGYLQALDDKFK